VCLAVKGGRTPSDDPSRSAPESALPLAELPCEGGAMVIKA
jgi:hypothetical protein